MKNILIVGDSRSEKVVRTMADIKSRITRAGQITEADLAEAPDLQGTEADLVCVFGGDGSLLRAVCSLGPNQVPVVGVNVGRLGFLTEFSETEFLEARWIAVRVDHDFRDLKIQAIDYTRENWFPAERPQTLVASPHAARFSAGEQNSNNTIRRDHSES